jgi:hypothetical protein
MVTRRVCKFAKGDGSACGSPPLHDGEFCHWHSPDHVEEVAEARRLGGLRRRRERTVAGAYDIEGLESVVQLRRVLDIVVLDAVGLENTVPRGRLLIAAILAGAKLLETGELADQLAAIKGVLEARLPASKRRR